MKIEYLTHFPDHRRCLIIPRTEVQLLFHLSNEPCVTFQGMVSTWNLDALGNKVSFSLGQFSHTGKKSETSTGVCRWIVSFLPRSHALLMRCVCGKADLSTRCHCALPPRVLKLNRSATEL